MLVPLTLQISITRCRSLCHSRVRLDPPELGLPARSVKVLHNGSRTMNPLYHDGFDLALQYRLCYFGGWTVCPTRQLSVKWE